MVFKRILTYSLCMSLFLSGCVTNQGPSNGLNVGPQTAAVDDLNLDFDPNPGQPKLEVIIPVFDPGLTKKQPTRVASPFTESGDNPMIEIDNTDFLESDDDDEFVWPELRRAEANRFAFKLKTALDQTGMFGAVRVTPDESAAGDIFIMGRIVESNGEDVEIDISVYDISGREWMNESFDHSVEKGFYNNSRNKNKDPYDPVFTDAAIEIASLLDKRSNEELTRLQNLTELRFASSLSDTAFAEYFKIEDGRLVLASMPSDEDPMLKRTRAIRIRDQLFIDGLQENYQAFSQDMEQSYRIWQEQSFLELKAERDAKARAFGQALASAGLIALAVLAIVAGARSSNPALGATAAIGAGNAGIDMMQKSFQTSEEAKVHRDALKELGQSIDLELGPRIIEFEEETVELTGDAKEQFDQWRAFLKQIYLAEQTPDRQL